MKKILLILVGGTICTSLSEDRILSVDKGAGALLKANFENSDSAYADKVEFSLSDNLFILSENLTVEKWNLMIEAYRNLTRGKKYDGIIFAHGTDTLAYSASLFSMLLSKTDIPVFFVSANERLKSERSNGNANFRYAVECICRGISPNVYVTYKNLSDGQMYLHLASRLEQCKNYSEDFYSVGALNITNISDSNCKEYFDKLKKLYPQEKRKSFINIYDDFKLSECVLMISPYIGINYDAFKFDRYSAVLHGTFHSGTACAEKTEHCPEYTSNSILHMIDICANSEPVVDTYLSPSWLSGDIYESVGIIGNHRANNQQIKFLYGYTTETAYAKLLLAYSVLKNKEQIAAFLDTECNFEFIKCNKGAKNCD